MQVHYYQPYKQPKTMAYSYNVNIKQFSQKNLIQYNELLMLDPIYVYY